MKMHAAVFVTTFVTLGGLLITLANCSSDPEQTEPGRGARKGEACQTTNDCAAGLSCVPAGSNGANICVLSNFTVIQTAKECAITECTVAADCCTPNPSCDQYAAQCADAGPGSAFCQIYESQCACTNRDCENSKCIQKCTTNAQCTNGSNRTCAGGKCVQCSSDDQCGGAGSSLKCVNGACQGPCQGDGDCPGFQRCVNQQCTDGACQTNRECVAATKNVEATCGTDGRCIVPCATDLECGSPRDFRFYSCVSGQCMFLGCETDKDCRLILEGIVSTSSSSGGSSGTSSGSLGGTRHIVCRDKTTPGNYTIPAR